MTGLTTLIKLAHDLRDSILEVEGDLEYRCALAANIVCRLVPEAEHMKGTYNGEQHHYAALDVEGELVIVDATVGQFADAPEVFVGVATADWAGVSYGNTQLPSGCDDQAVMQAMAARGWLFS